MRSILTFLADIIQTIVLALVIFVVVNFFLVQPHKVQGASMEPNFHDGEFLLTDKISYRFDDPKRGQVIVFHARFDPGQRDYIKRIVGLPNETVKIVNGEIYINGQRLNQEFSSLGQNAGGQFLKEGQEITIPQDSYFVLGDNRNHSADSRSFGTIKRKDFVGRVWLRYWPVASFGLVDLTQ